MQLRQFSELKMSLAAVAGVVILLTLTLALAINCGKKKDESKETESSSALNREYFADWQKYKSQWLEFRYPLKMDLQNRIEAIGNKCDEILTFVSMVLKTKPPQPIYVMLFVNKSKAEEMLGRELPYVSGDTIYHEMFSPLGIGITKLMMEQVIPGGSSFDFINEGLPTLFDFSGKNYHKLALQHIEDGTAFTIMDIVDNEKYRKMPEQQRKEEAASFIGYLTYKFGSTPLLGLMKYDLSANATLMMSTKMNPQVHDLAWRNNLPKLASLDSLESQP